MRVRTCMAREGPAARGMLALMLGAGVLAGVLCSPDARAVEWSIFKDPALYGHLDQHLVDPVWGGMACAPTSAVNSFVYLENMYPWIYDDLLVPGDNTDISNLVAAAQLLASPLYMDTTLLNGTFWYDFVWGKYEYIEDHAPGSTVYESQEWFTWPAVGDPRHDPPDWSQHMLPTWEFIYDELVACEDVEIFVMHANGGHALTLTSFYWDDTDNDGVIDQAEDARIDFIDPWTGAWGESDIWHSGGAGSLIETSYFGTTTSGIYGVVSESPVPEPATLLMLGALGAGMVAARRIGSWKKD